MKQHFTPEQTTERLSPQDMGLAYTSAQRYDICGNVTIASNEEELCLVVIDGGLYFTIGETQGSAVMRDMLYLPIHSEITLTSNRATVIRFGAPCTRHTQFAHIAFADVDADTRHKVYGKAEQGTLRDVWNYIDEAFDSSRFLVGICRGTDGGWTAWPPHRHGNVREEVYVYFNMGNAFALQCVYEDMNHPKVDMVQDGHLIAIPEGYHPNVGCPGGGISYVYCMVSVTAEDRNFMDLTTQKIYGDRLE